MNKIINTTLLVGAWTYLQVSELTGGIVGRAFDQAFSLGLLALAVYLLWKDNKESRAYNRKRDARIEELVESNTEALNDFTSVLEKVVAQND